MNMNGYAIYHYNTYTFLLTYLQESRYCMAYSRKFVSEKAEPHQQTAWLIEDVDV